MRVIMVTYDSLNRHMLPNYGNTWVKAPNFERLGERAVTFTNSYCGSMPCMPARRELHTGRYNFLHRPWGPMEPYDDSMPEILNSHGYETHLVSDHSHYWEDGGATYHTRYGAWECNRGQEGDPWKTMLCPPPAPEHLGQLWDQDWVNRQFIQKVEDMPQTKTFSGGLEFLDLNHGADNWFLHIETFDPHEPFYAMPEFKELYEKSYDGPLFDWPPYREVSEEEKPYVEHVRHMYAALLTMCDQSLGKVLDKMDEYQMWEDTLLIVNTDHGFFVGEHDYWGKGMNVYVREEVSHTPLFIYDPVSKQTGKNESLVQTIDIAPTILDYCGIAKTKDMQGISLLDTIRHGTPVHDAIIYGVFGSQITCVSEEYKYILSPNEQNWPLYHYLLMPTHMRSMYAPGEFEGMELSEPFSFTKGIRLMKLADHNYIGGNVSKKEKRKVPALQEVHPHEGWNPEWKTVLYNLKEDPHEDHPIRDEKVEQELRQKMVRLMIENDAPVEQYERMNLQKEYEAQKQA